MNISSPFLAKITQLSTHGDNPISVESVAIIPSIPSNVFYELSENVITDGLPA